MTEFEAAPGAGVFTPVRPQPENNGRPDHRIDRAIRAAGVPGYGGDLTIEVLEAKLVDLKVGIAKLEIALAAIRTRELLRSELQRIGFKGDANDRAAVASDALRYGQDTAKLVAAVKTLTEKGALR